MLLHRHRAILWCAFALARLNSRGVGLFEKPCFVPDGGGGGGVLSSWVSCCCTDTGLSCGVHLG